MLNNNAIDMKTTKLISALFALVAMTAVSCNKENDKVDVPPVLEGIQVSPATATIYIGETQDLTVSQTPATAVLESVEWSSSDETVATVLEGVVTGVAKGNATITASAGEFTASCEITVKEHVSELVSGVGESMLLGIGHTKFISFTVVPETADDRSCTYASSDESVVTINEGGYMQGVAKGTCTVSVTSNDNPDAKIEVEITVDEYAEVKINYFVPVTYKTGELSSVLAEYMAKETVTRLAWTQPSKVNSTDVKAMSGYGSETRVLETLQQLDLSKVDFVAGGDTYRIYKSDSKDHTTIDGYVPYGICYSAPCLTKVILPESATVVDDYAFAYCSKISELTLPSGLKSICYYSFSSIAVDEIVFPESLERFGTSSFANSKLKKVTIGKNVVALTNGWAHCFSGCYSMEEYVVSSENQYFKADNGILTNKAGTELISYPSAKLIGTIYLPTEITLIDPYGIYPSNGKLTDLVLGEGITRLDMYALNNVWNDELTLPSTLNMLCCYAIYNAKCSTLVVKSTTPPTLFGASDESQLFPLYRPSNEDYVIKVPAESVDAYKAAKGWKNVADKIQAIE